MVYYAFLPHPKLEGMIMKVHYKSHTIEEVRNVVTGKLLTTVVGPKLVWGTQGHRETMVPAATKMIDGCPTCGGALTELGVCEDCGGIE